MRSTIAIPCGPGINTKNPESSGAPEGGGVPHPTRRFLARGLGPLTCCHEPRGFPTRSAVANIFATVSMSLGCTFPAGIRRCVRSSSFTNTINERHRIDEP